MNESYGKRRIRPCVYFQQGKCNRPQCNFSHNIIAPGHSNGTAESSYSSMTLSVNTPANPSQSSSDDAYPRTSYKTKPCRFYARGKCTAGDACRWSHDDGTAAAEEDAEDNEYVPGGYKLVPKSYRTLPCARYQLGHCFYGDDCNFIHATPQTSSASTPPVNPQRNLGSSPPHLPPSVPAQIIHKAHSTHHSPAISSLNAPGIRSSISASTPPSSTVGAVLSAPTRPRELPPPQSQAHYSGVNWSLPAIGTPGTPSKGIGTPPIFASSPLITAATEWSHVPLSRSNSLQPPQDSATNGTTSQNGPQTQMRSPYLLTFGEIGPGGVNSATGSPRGLGLNGDSLSAVGGASTSGGFTAPPPNGGNLRIGSPALGFGSALGTTGIVMARQKSRLSTTDVLDEDALANADAETEPDFPSIRYGDLNDLVTEPDDTRQPAVLDYELREGVANALRNGPGGEYHGANGYGPHTAGLDRVGSFSGAGPDSHMNGYSNGGRNGYENDWGHALNMLQGQPAPFTHQQTGMSSNYTNGYGDQYRGGYKSRPCKYYVVGSRCPSGQNCTFIHDPEAMHRGNMPYSPPPKQTGDMHPLFRTRECKYHLAGRCHQEEACDFKHTGPPGQGREYENWEGFSIKVREHEAAAEDRTTYRSRPCKWFLKGNCFHGDQCTYLHDYNYLRPPCHFFRNGAGQCMAGDNCRFSHDVVEADDSEQYYASLDDPGPDQAHGGPHPSLNYSSGSMSQVVSTVYDGGEDTHESQQYNEPYFGGINGSTNGDSLTVQGPRMELIVSEGEDDDEDEDIVVMQPGFTTRSDHDNQDVEQLFASLSVAGTS